MIVMLDLHNRFQFHPASDDEKRNAHTSVPMTLERAASDILQLLPSTAGREAALFVTKLEEAMFWGNAGIARNP